MAEGFGLPSGPAQSSVVIWGMLAAWARRPWFWPVFLAVIILVGLSRVYLGVHFPTDVLAGWVIGALVLAGFLALGPPAANCLRRRDFAFRLTLAVTVPLS